MKAVEIERPLQLRAPMCLIFLRLPLKVIMLPSLPKLATSLATETVIHGVRFEIAQSHSKDISPFPTAAFAGWS